MALFLLRLGPSPAPGLSYILPPFTASTLVVALARPPHRRPMPNRPEPGHATAQLKHPPHTGAGLQLAGTYINVLTAARLPITGEQHHCQLLIFFRAPRGAFAGDLRWTCVKAGRDGPDLQDSLREWMTGRLSARPSQNRGPSVSGSAWPSGDDEACATIPSSCQRRAHTPRGGCPIYIDPPAHPAVDSARPIPAQLKPGHALPFHQFAPGTSPFVSWLDPEGSRTASTARAPDRSSCDLGSSDTFPLNEVLERAFPPRSCPFWEMQWRMDPFAGGGRSPRLIAGLSAGLLRTRTSFLVGFGGCQGDTGITTRFERDARSPSVKTTITMLSDSGPLPACSLS
ncbi:hypothetical protein VUR80DRAFT_5255 [Thermomyces stellatus]